MWRGAFCVQRGECESLVKNVEIWYGIVCWGVLYRDVLLLGGCIWQKEISLLSI